MSQEHSKLYHYLATFETDTKRRLAMETRRLEILQGLLTSLNRAAFEVLHKQVAYELGETYLALLDIKLDKLRGRGGGEVNEAALKKTEIAKCHYYCKGVLAMFAHFTNMYVPTDRPRADAFVSLANFDGHTIGALGKAGCTQPDESLISAEVPPYLSPYLGPYLSPYLSPCNGTFTPRYVLVVPTHGAAVALCFNKHILVLSCLVLQLPTGIRAHFPRV